MVIDREGDDQIIRKIRGISVRPDAAAGSAARPPRKDLPSEFRPITIKGLDRRLETALTQQGLTYRQVDLEESTPAQLLIYRNSEVERAQQLSAQAQGNVLKILPPEGIIWDNSARRYVALPIVWTDALTETVKLTRLQNGAVRVETQDRPGNGRRTEARILFQGDVYTEQSWTAATQVSQFAVQGLGLPAGSPVGHKPEKPSPVTWKLDATGFFDESGFYSAPPGTRYGFMGWVKPKKN